MSEAARDNMRKKDKERKQRKREELAKEKENEERTTYKTPAALGKAQTKAMKALPSDPQRAQEVVMGMKKMLDKTVHPDPGRANLMSNFFCEVFFGTMMILRGSLLTQGVTSSSRAWTP